MCAIALFIFANTFFTLANPLWGQPETVARWAPDQKLVIALESMVEAPGHKSLTQLAQIITGTDASISRTQKDPLRRYLRKRTDWQKALYEIIKNNATYMQLAKHDPYYSQTIALSAYAANPCTMLQTLVDQIIPNATNLTCLHTATNKLMRILATSPEPERALTALQNWTKGAINLLATREDLTNIMGAYLVTRPRFLAYFKALLTSLAQDHIALQKLRQDKSHQFSLLENIAQHALAFDPTIKPHWDRLAT
jgi:hypothetical protein